jgi:hypothetical protein
MIRCTLLLLLAIAHSAVGQTATFSSLGILVKPHESLRAPAELRTVVPKKAVIRLIQTTRLSAEGETVVIYDRGDQVYPTDAHIAIIKSGKRVADFSIIKVFERQGVGDTYALFQAAKFAIPDTHEAFVAAFRNVGDGAGTLFVVLTESEGQYRVSWRRWASQAQLRVREDGTYELWDSDQGDDCVWCAHHYEVSQFKWKEGRLFPLSHYETKDALDPSQFSERPIVIGDMTSAVWP